MRNNNFNAPLLDYDMGILFTVINDVPEVGHSTFYKTNFNIAREAYHEDPFAIVFLQTDKGNWYKCDRGLADSGIEFHRVGHAAVPAIILMMGMLQP